VKQLVISNEIARKLVNRARDLVTFPVPLRPVGLRTGTLDDPFARVLERSYQALLVIVAEVGAKRAADHVVRVFTRLGPGTKGR
jgi:hypothetical protein